MKRKLIRAVAVLLTVLVFVSAMPLTAFADEAGTPDVQPVSETGSTSGFDEPTPTPESTAEPEANSTPEPDQEESAEPSPQPTAEPTQESTSTPESSPEPSAPPEADTPPGASDEPSAEPTAEPSPTPIPVDDPYVDYYEVIDCEYGGRYAMVLPDIEGITVQYSPEHPAWDMAAPLGAPVIAADDGVVINTQVWNGIVTNGDNNSYGHMVEIEHADGNITLYAHLSEINVQQGDTVVRGQQIGRVGDTGNATGAHLHFEIIMTDGKADPYPYLTGMSLYEFSSTNGRLWTMGQKVLQNAPTTTTFGSMSSGGLFTRFIGATDASGGTVAYCIQKDVETDLGVNSWYTQGNIRNMYDEWVCSRIGDILALGYFTENASTDLNWNDNNASKWAATQVALWEVTRSGVTEATWHTAQSKADAHTILSYTPNSTLAISTYDTIVDTVVTKRTAPSFNGNTISLTWNGSKYTATVTDDKGVLSNFDYASSTSGITFSRNGNNLTISTSSPLSSTATATATKSYTYGGYGGVFAWVERYQHTTEWQWIASRKVNSTSSMSSTIYVKTVDPTYNIKLNKTSSNPTMTNGNSSYSLSGAVYNVYAGTTASGTIVATLTTNANGQATSSVKLKNGTYAVKESSAPKGYKLDTTTHTVTINYSDATLNVSDEPIPMEYNINLTKTSANVSITNGDSGYSLSGAVYKVYNSSNTEVATITTDATGKGSSSVKLKNGTYTVVETTAPQGYALDTTRHTVTINNADAPLSVSDIPLIKTVTLTKTSANTSITAGNSQYSLAGAKYNVYIANGDPDHDYTSDTVVATFTTGADGKATLSRVLKPNTRYAILETQAPPGYVKDTTVHTFLLDYDANTMDVVDDPQYIKLTVRKKDSGTGLAQSQGNASLAGAVYQVTYLENGSDKTVVGTTNENGVIYFLNIPLGKVSVQEIAAPVGYKLDATIHTYNITSDQTTSVVYDLEPDFPEEVFKGKISITKQSEMLGAPAQIEQGAEYQVYLKSAGSYANAKESERDYLVTGADGKATTKDLPYGTYTLHQVRGVAGREFKDMDVDVHENGRTYEVTLTNKLKYAQLKIVKTSEDGNVAGFTFMVTRLADGSSATYTTNAAGEIITDQMPVYVDAAGTQKFEYRVEEINVPNQYRTPDPQTVTLMYGQTASVSFYNKISRGTLEILKVDHNGTTPLRDAVYKITDAGGTVIATKTTDATGKITVENLVYGSYHYQEIAAPKGYDLDPTVYDFSIDYDEQIVAVTRENTPSIGSITFSKVDTGGNPMSGVAAALEYSTDNGATWNPVTARTAGSKVSIGGCTSAGLTNGVLITGSDGKAVFSGLQIDNQTVTILYRLTEVATLDNKMLMAETLFEGSLPVTIDGAERVDITISAVNSRSYELPGAGGAGMWLVPIGAALLLVSLFCVVLVIKKSRKGKEN